MRPLRESPPLPSPSSLTPEGLSAFLSTLDRSLREQFLEIAQAVNDELLVRPDWIRALDEDYTALVSDRILLFFPTSNRVLTLPDPDSWEEPHPIFVRHAGSANTLTIDPDGSIQIDGAGTLPLSAGEGRIIVPLTTRVVYRDGVGTVAWYSLSSI